MNGVWEAVYHGVPIVAIPLFGDQYDNAQRLVSRGMAVKLDISTLTSNELEQAIRIVIRDTRLEFCLIHAEFKRGNQCNICPKVLAIKCPDTHYPFMSVVMYADKVSVVLSNSRFTPLKSMREGHLDIRDSQILYTGSLLTLITT